MDFKVPKLSGITMPDMRQLTVDATTMFSRAVQYTEEKLGSAEKTEYDANFENLVSRYDKTKLWTERLKSQTETALQPNPNTRMEDYVYMKLDRKPPERPSSLEQLGTLMKEAGNDFGPGTSYGGVLIRCGETQVKLGQAEQTFLHTTMHNFLHPLNNFLEGDCKTIQKERKTLEKKRLDLDACKSRAKKAKTLESRQVAENELRIAQTDFDRQHEITKLLLEGVSSTQAHHSRSLKEFVDAQTEYFSKCYEYMKALQDHLKNTEPSPVFNRVGGSRGSIPVANITTNQSQAATDDALKKARVLYDYDAGDTTELSLLADEIIFIQEAPLLGKDWMMGQRGTSRGKVPASYVKVLQ